MSSAVSAVTEALGTVIDPEIRRQHRAAQALGEPSEEDRRRMEESLRVLERTTPSVYD